MKRTWTSEELTATLYPPADELVAVGNKSGATRLGFAVLTAVFAVRRPFPSFQARGAPDVVRFLAAEARS
jgi:hypothetical protein